MWGVKRLEAPRLTAVVVPSNTYYELRVRPPFPAPSVWLFLQRHGGLSATLRCRRGGWQPFFPEFNHTLLAVIACVTAYDSLDVRQR